MAKEKKPYPNGTYTQVPNVFFDTCNLPETAQILYLRLYRHLAYKQDGQFTGSVRRLSNLVRLSKSTVDRMVKRLRSARLINIAYENEEEQKGDMTITINVEDLWNLNRYHSNIETVPNWDTALPDCPNLNHNCLNVGQDSPKLGQSVPGSSSNEEGITNKEVKENEERISSPRKSSGFVTGIMQRVSRTLHDWHHLEENIAKGQEIFDAAQVDLATFKMRVDAAMKQASNAKLEQLHNYGFQDRMHYFFYTLCELLHLR